MCVVIPLLKLHSDCGVLWQTVSDCTAIQAWQTSPLTNQPLVIPIL